ncbi:hypothetical protein scyTo_0020269, partial [Scyliorhinus torazame]|nr:hypothetical protein [Scyliorhinus torazame]
LEDRRRTQMEVLATLIQKTYRGWRCRTHFRLMKKSQILISAWFRGHNQQKKYQQLKKATIFLQACTRGWEVRKCHRKYFKSNASKTIRNFIISSIIQKYFLSLKNTLPSMSPTDKKWPALPYLFLDKAHQELKRIFCLWKCKKYRETLSNQKKAELEEKLYASELFKDKKAAYASSVPQPFKGMYMDAQRKAKYQKLASSIEGKLLMMDTATKINRKDGKQSPRILIMTNSYFVLADPKSLQIKTLIKMNEIASISMSQRKDGLFALHVVENSSVGPKGDFLLNSDHLVELTTKLHRSILDATQQKIN